MSDVTCARCGRQAPGLAAAPLPGEIGKLLVQRVCTDCWGEWLREQVKHINEYQLRPSEPEHYERLIGAMKTFLKLAD